MKNQINPHDRFGRLSVINEVGRINGRRRFLCKCDCGSETTVFMNNLKRKNGGTKSCGCLRRQATYNMTHGQKNTRLYGIWNGMKDRCLNKNSKYYERYGKRGIRVCNSWLQFESFYEWAHQNGYTKRLTIERKNNNGDYAPENCEWIPLSDQAKNRSNTITVFYKGVEKTLKDWSHELGIDYATLYSRIKYRKWSIEKALSVPSLINRKEKTEIKQAS